MFHSIIRYNIPKDISYEPGKSLQGQEGEITLYAQWEPNSPMVIIVIIVIIGIGTVAFAIIVGCEKCDCCYINK